MDKGLEDKQIVIFGTGSSSETVKRLLKSIGLHFAFYTDNNTSLWGTKLNGKDIMNPSELIPEKHTVIIGSMYKKEIAEQLQGYGFIEHENFIYPDNFILRNGKFEYLKNQTYFPQVQQADYQKKNPDISILTQQVKPFVTPNMLDEKRYPNFTFPIQELPGDEIGVNILKNAYTIGQSGSVLNHALQPIRHLTTFSMVNMGLWDGRRWNAQWLENLVPKPQLIELEGKVAVTTTRWSGTNYYHWLFEELPRFYLLEKSGLKVDKYICNYRETSYQKATLAELNIDVNQLISSSDAYGFKAQTLYAPYSPYYDSGYVATWVCDFLRETFLHKSELSKGKRIYVKRGNTRYRKVLNEAQLIDLLQKYDFEVVDMGDYTIYDQASIFNTADIIISAHGAALSNVVFCKEGAKLVEIFNPLYMPTMYWGIASQVGMKYYCSLGKNLDTHFNETTSEILLAKDIEVELSQIEKFLREYL